MQNNIRRQLAGHPSRTRLEHELQGVRDRGAAIDSDLGYRERTLVESAERRKADRAIDRRRKWLGRGAVLASAATLAGGAVLVGRAIAQNEASHQADAGNIPQHVKRQEAQNAAEAAAQATAIQQSTGETK